jgi:hypothetical protein
MKRIPTRRPTRTERIRLAAAALRGAATGAVGAIAAWLLDHLPH